MSESSSCLADVERRAVSKLAGENERSRGLWSRCIAYFVYHALRLTVHRSNRTIVLQCIDYIWRRTDFFFLSLGNYRTVFAEIRIGPLGLEKTRVFSPLPSWRAACSNAAQSNSQGGMQCTNIVFME